MFGKINDKNLIGTGTGTGCFIQGIERRMIPTKGNTRKPIKYRAQIMHP